MTTQANIRITHENAGAFDQIRRRLESGALIKIGFPVGAEELDGTSSAMVAAKHEFGSPSERIPERPFLRSGVFEQLTKYRAFSRRGLVRVLNGGLRFNDMLELLGQTAAADVKEKIRNGPFKPLSQRTIAMRQARRSAGYNRQLARRGAADAIDKPLIDTGYMRQNVTYEIEVE